jgi:MFS family permease
LLSKGEKFDLESYRSRVFVVLWSVSFVLTFAVSLISTPVPYLIRSFLKGGDVQAAFELAYGVLLSLGYAAITVGYFVGGFAADWFGKKAVVTVSFIVMAIGCGLYAFSSSIYLLFLAAAVLQFGSGFSAPAFSALVADYSVESSRGMAYGVFNLSWIVAQIPAPLLGGVIAQFMNLQAPFVFGIFVCIVGVFASVLMEGKQAKRKLTAKTSHLDEASNNLVPYGKTVLVFSLANTLNGLLNGFLNPLMTGFLVFRMNAGAAQYGLVLSLAFGLVTAIVQIPGGRLADRFGRKPLALFSFLSAPLMFLLAFSQTILEFGLLMGGICAISNISAPAIAAWLMDLTPNDKRTRVSGITRASNGVGLVVGPVAGSYVWNASKPNAALPFGVLTIIFISGMPFYAILKDTKNHQNK